MHRVFTHTITIAAALSTCQRFFSPAGEELWVDGWRPTYLHPADGRTQRGMVFTTGSGDDFTVWGLADFDALSGYARYSRVTPVSRSAWVEVRCQAAGPQATAVEVTYSMTALTPAGESAIAAMEGGAFAAMIEQWRAAIDARLPQLCAATIR
ncbi:MAG TPA: SRPBCC family protein [Albitalea sp.]